ncbi:centromere/kinetochore protein zw10 homolog [Papio anubis]|uniref:Centromere/kinetochore protein zw10 homolog n=4 Tax=Cercopithecinae TaxID=9528 RepID=A0A2K5LER1_CERAT|nr:centromere/kinetochore protein zw10 homolog [Papio anubis]XP_005579735.1 centromere/kinetochore protein zw10 homolog [Macaca fascicularis]XP_011759633.1 centromere/kinetochore protein zw10 homolog [Macaca nemestrina]XP_011921701.1 PREDICTED: centromere/kinetochore protein zw10 homolog isoform X1 [Cercocebus atys]XP_025213937.1 centromere/kinetochore protein zw10 homolog [Theropithecus gelada]
MASFVTEVLAHSGRLEKEDLGTRISRLTRRVEEIKGEVCNMISKKYSEFLPSMQSAQGLITQVDKLSEDIDLLKSRIESEVCRDLHVSTGEFTDLKQQLERDSVVLSLLKQLQEFSTAIEEYNCALTEKKYVTGAQHLEEAQKCLKLLKSRKCFDLKILKSLSMELTIQKQNILYHLGEEWQKLIVWKFPPSKDTSSLESYLQTELHLYTEQSHKEEKTPMPPISSVLLAFSVLGELHSKLKSFGQMLLKYILRPLASCPSLHAVIESQPNIVIRFESIMTNLEYPSPSEVFTKIRLVLEVLQKQLLDLSLDSDLENEKTSTVPLAEMLGDMIWEDLSECLIKNCLVYSIPTNSSKLQQYEEIIQSTEEFENALKEMRFLKGDTTDLLKYARNINSHFANKKCQDVIVAARNLMTSEIHNTVKIIPDSKINVPELPTPDEDNKLEVQKVSNTQYNEVVNLEPENTLDQHSFSLPTCRISESVKKLMELAYQTLLEATTSSDQCAVQLFYSVRNIFHLFHDVVPTYHKENLQKLPQLAAIHHNNCMYIAHHLLTLGHQFRLRLAPILCDGTATFVDLVPGFRRLGTECFLAQMRAQKGELLERLSSARNFSNMDDEENYSVASKAVRQVLHQLKRLGIVWQDVLPVNIYCKAMGTLLNTAISEIIGKITALEDISTEDGDRLYSLCKTVMDEGPQVFAPLSEESKNKKYQEEVPVYVPKWMPFKELMMMLQASLQEIGDRWADGKGPLAAAFSSSEVKALIRALFQNTERRAAALAKIK